MNDGRQYQAINRAALTECEARLEARDREIERLRHDIERYIRIASEAEAECEWLRGKVQEISEACQMDADRYRDDPNAWRACVSLDGYAEDLAPLATPPPEKEAHPLRLDRVQTCEFHGRDFGACAQHSGQIPCEPEGGDAPHAPEHTSYCPRCTQEMDRYSVTHCPSCDVSVGGPPPSEQAHGDALAALKRLEWPADYEGREADIRTVLQALTASGVPHVPEEVRRLPEKLRHRYKVGIPNDLGCAIAHELEKMIERADGPSLSLPYETEQAIKHALFLIRHGESAPEVTRADTIQRLESALASAPAVPSAPDEPTDLMAQEGMKELPVEGPVMWPHLLNVYRTMVATGRIQKEAEMENAAAPTDGREHD